MLLLLIIIIIITDYYYFVAANFTSDVAIIKYKFRYGCTTHFMMLHHAHSTLQ